ncbi:uncharacterized protein LOC128660797 [Bombina bombina]|uniref:uncharacterized protein LOC128660797 n=1 Tax=Bombina bombina TaxID=8345 RepID=UPI00235AFDF5|nr:uncharacterized protein LOC128660797 [Bombina bombina]
MVTESAPLFDDIAEEDDSSREVILNLVPVPAPEGRSPESGSLTPDLTQMAQDQDLDIHEPVINPRSDEENTNSPPDHGVQAQGIEPLEQPQAIVQEQAPLEDAGLNEMLNLARGYRADSRQVQEILSGHLERFDTYNQQRLELDREIFNWQREMDMERNLHINRALTIAENNMRMAQNTMQTLLELIRDRHQSQESPDPKRTRFN